MKFTIESGELNAVIEAQSIQKAMNKLLNYQGTLGVLLRYKTKGTLWKYWDTIAAFKSGSHNMKAVRE